MNQHFTHTNFPISASFADNHTFSAKERDAETGLSYFGARYYSSDLSIWLSVDPMSDKYPSLSPYVYCADNPVKLVDPNGEELEVANNEESHNDILSIVNDYNRPRIAFGEDGKVSVNMDGVKVPDAGLSLINDMANSDKKFYYETSDVALCRDKDGNRKTVSLISEQSLGCLNASVGGLDSQGEHTFLPIEGFDGQVVITKTGSFHYGLQNRRRNIVYHELAENYLRTDQGLNYFGNGMAGRGGAHQTAASWEFAAWGTMEPGTAQFTLGNPTSLISSFNRDKNYLINGIYK